jgi:hypothetical protein
VDVFSNDASLLKPVEALEMSGSLQLAYVVLGWPQTIAKTDDPDTNFNPSAPIDLRGFVTIVGTRPDTFLRFTSSTQVVPGHGVPALSAGESFEVMLQPFEVLNLETGGFLADFTGSLVESNKAVVVFSGAEAADAPAFDTLADRFCCADHLEEQLDPIRTAGMKYIAAHSPNRGKAVAEAGALLTPLAEPDFFRVLALSNEGPTVIKTNLPAPDDHFELPGRGAYLDLAAYEDFALIADQPVTLASILASQDACSVKRPLPGGDPSLVIIPPIEQFRMDYVFLTPDKYAFDFIVISAPPDATIMIDGLGIDEYGCEVGWALGGERPMLDGMGETVVYRCQLSFPLIDPLKPAEEAVAPGKQNDGVHRVLSDRRLGVLVFGFDERVSYGYAAGTQLEAIAIF